MRPEQWDGKQGGSRTEKLENGRAQGFSTLIDQLNFVLSQATPMLIHICVCDLVFKTGLEHINFNSLDTLGL
jgi:hypothetical protein